MCRAIKPGHAVCIVRDMLNIVRDMLNIVYCSGCYVSVYRGAMTHTVWGHDWYRADMMHIVYRAGHCIMHIVLAGSAGHVEYCVGHVVFVRACCVSRKTICVSCGA